MKHARGRRSCVALLTVAGLVLLSTAAHAGWLAGYDYRQEITVNPSVTPGDRTGFPLLVSITNPGNDVFAKATSPAGLDVVFTDGDVTRVHRLAVEERGALGLIYYGTWVKEPDLPEGELDDALTPSIKI